MIISPGNNFSTYKSLRVLIFTLFVSLLLVVFLFLTLFNCVGNDTNEPAYLVPNSDVPRYDKCCTYARAVFIRVHLYYNCTSYDGMRERFGRDLHIDRDGHYSAAKVIIVRACGHRDTVFALDNRYRIFSFFFFFFFACVHACVYDCNKTFSVCRFGIVPERVSTEESSVSLNAVQLLQRIRCLPFGQCEMNE